MTKEKYYFLETFNHVKRVGDVWLGGLVQIMNDGNGRCSVTATVTREQGLISDRLLDLTSADSLAPARAMRIARYYNYRVRRAYNAACTAEINAMYNSKLETDLTRLAALAGQYD